MQKNSTLFIVLGSFLIVLLLTGIYLNYKMDQLVKAINRPGVVFSDPEFSPAPEEMVEEEIVYEERKDKWSEHYDRKAITNQSSSEVVPPDESSHKDIPIKKDDIITGVQKKIDRPVDKKDLVQAGIIILRRLNWSEVEYLYKAGNKENLNDEELKKIHQVLRLRLTEDEIKVMQDLARKYGKDLDFLSAKSL